MDITRIAIEKNRITVAFLLVILLGGLSAYQKMPRAEDPGFIIRAATVITYFPGAGPRRVEELVTDPIEEVIQQIPELDFVTSESKTGFSMITVNILESEKKMRPIWDNLRRKVESVEPDLPSGLIGPFVNDEFGDTFGTIVMLTGEGYSYAELKDVADDVRDEMLLIREIAKVDILGAQEERVFVEYEHSKLAEIGLSPVQLQDILGARNIIIPGGSVDSQIERIALEPSGNFDTIDDLRNTIIQRPGSTALIRLRDIAKISRGYVDPPKSIARANGQAALAIAVNMRKGGNIIHLGEKVKAAVARLQVQYPIGIEFEFAYDEATFVAKKIDEFVVSLYQSVGIVLLVMLLTLGFRTGFVVASLIPSAMIFGLLVMSWLDIGIDQMSLAALIIALGMLVDNSIVMSESILVSMSEGKKPVDAAIESARELKIPLLTSSLTTAAAFLPIYLAKSAVGEYTAPLFKVVTITLLCSWTLALTMIPVLCVLFLKPKPNKGESFDSSFYRGYRATLQQILRHPLLTGILIVGVFVGVMSLFRFLPNIFMPASDKPVFTVEVTMPPGTRIERTAEVIDGIEVYMSEVLNQDNEIINWMTFVGESPPRFVLGWTPQPSKPELAGLVVNARHSESMPRLTAQLENWARANYPDAVPDVRALPMGPPVKWPVEIRFSGKDEDKLFEILETTKQELQKRYRLKNVQDDWGQRTKKLLVDISQTRARRAGLTSQDVAISLQTSLSGLETTEYREGEKTLPVMLRSSSAHRTDLGKLESASIFAQASGDSVPLKQVADIKVDFEPSNIRRRNRLKTIALQATIEDGATENPISIANEMTPWLEAQKKNWAPGYGFQFGGDLEQSAKSNQSIADQLPIALFIIVLLLVAQFNSLRRPTIILMTVPLGVIGVVLGLLGAGSYFGFMTLLGIISLAGIVINNAIVLIERIDLEIRENGLEPPRAIIEAAQRRLRPILLTTATTVGGLLPLWFGGGPMWEPMAIAIIFGLLFATTLTLGVVPLLYSVFFRVRFDGFEY